MRIYNKLRIDQERMIMYRFMYIFLFSTIIFSTIIVTLLVDMITFNLKYAKKYYYLSHGLYSTVSDICY